MLGICPERSRVLRPAQRDRRCLPQGHRVQSESRSGRKLGLQVAAPTPLPPHWPKATSPAPWPAWGQVTQWDSPPGGAAFGCPCAVLPTCAALWEHSLSGSEKLRGRLCGEPRGCAGHPGPWSVSREQERLCPPRCPAPEVRHSPRSSPYLRDVGFFTLSLHAHFLSESSRHCIAIETELVKIPCSLLIIEFQRQAKRSFQGLELRLRGGGEQPTRTGHLWELAGRLRDSQSRAQAPRKGPGQAHSDLGARP